MGIFNRLRRRRTSSLDRHSDDAQRARQRQRVRQLFSGKWLSKCGHLSAGLLLVTTSVVLLATRFETGSTAFFLFATGLFLAGIVVALPPAEANRIGSRSYQRRFAIEQLEERIVLSGVADIEILTTDFTHNVGEFVRIEGRALDASGQPVADAQIGVHDSLRRQSLPVGNSLADGRFYVTFSNAETRNLGLYPLTFFAAGTSVKQTVVVSLADMSGRLLQTDQLPLNVGIVGDPHDVNATSRVISPAELGGLLAASEADHRALLESYTTIYSDALKNGWEEFNDNPSLGDKFAAAVTGISCGISPAVPSAAPLCLDGVLHLSKSFATEVVEQLFHGLIDKDLQNGLISPEVAQEQHLYVDGAFLGWGVMRVFTGGGVVSGVASTLNVAEASIEFFRNLDGHIDGARFIAKDATTGIHHGVVAQSRPDDHGSSAGSATSIGVNVSTEGGIELTADADWFHFNATAGNQYVFETTLNILNDSSLTLYDKDGTSVLLTDDNGGVGLASRITWTAQQSGGYYISVSGNGSNTGSYGLQIAEDVVASEPEIEVRTASGVDVVDGSSSIDFGNVVQGAQGPSRSIVVKNVGNSNLSLGNVSQPSGFTITDPLVSVLAPNQSDTLTVRLDSSAVGEKVGSLSFATNDADENPFNFMILGEVDSSTPDPAAPLLAELSATPSTVRQGSVFTLTATGVTDPNNNVQSVEFYHDTNSNNSLDDADNLLGTVSSISSQTANANLWANLPAGSHRFFAQAIDSTGLRSPARSATVTMVGETNASPTIDWVWLSSATVDLGEDLVIRWLAVDDVAVDHIGLYLYRGSGTSDAFKVDTTPYVVGGNPDGRLAADAFELANSGSYRLTIPGNLPPADDYRIKVVAWDGDDPQVAKTEHRFTRFFSVSDDLPRILSLSANPGVFIEGQNQSTTLTATVADAHRIDFIRFTRDSNGNSVIDAGDELIADVNPSNGTAITSYNVSQLVRGEHTLIAQPRFDDGTWGNRVIHRITVTARSNQPPTLPTLTASPTSFVRGENVTLIADCGLEQKADGSNYCWLFSE